MAVRVGPNTRTPRYQPRYPMTSEPMPANTIAPQVAALTVRHAVAANAGADTASSGIIPPTRVSAEMSMSDTRCVTGSSSTVYHAQQTAAATTIASPTSVPPADSCTDPPRTTSAIPTIDSATPAYPRAPTCSIPNQRPNSAMSAGEAASSSAAFPARVCATPSANSV